MITLDELIKKKESRKIFPVEVSLSDPWDDADNIRISDKIQRVEAKGDESRPRYHISHVYGWKNLITLGRSLAEWTNQGFLFLGKSSQGLAYFDQRVFHTDDEDFPVEGIDEFELDMLKKFKESRYIKYKTLSVAYRGPGMGEEFDRPGSDACNQLSEAIIRYGIDGFINSDGFEYDEYLALLLCDEPFTNNHGYIIIGSSGSGKSSLARHMSSYLKDMVKITKITTREVRPSDILEGTAAIPYSEFSKMARSGKISGCQSSSTDDRDKVDSYGYATDEIMEAIRNGKDCIIDTSQIGVALSLRKEFRDYFRIVYLDSDPYDIEQRLVRRYNRIPEDHEFRREYIERIKDIRLIGAERYAKNKGAMLSNADLIIPPLNFGMAQKMLRDYILGIRFPDAGLDYRPRFKLHFDI